MKFKNKFIESILLINSILSGKYKLKILCLVLFNVINSFLEVLSIALLIPFIGIFFGGQYNKYTNYIQQNFDNKNEFILYGTIFLITIFFLAMIAKIYILHLNYKISRDIGSEITLNILNKYLNLGYKNIIKTGSSYIVDLVAYKCTNIVINLIMPIINIMSSLTLIIIALMSVSLLNISGIYLALGGAVIIYISIIGITNKITSEISTKKNLITGEMISALNQAYAGIRGILLSSAQNQIVNDYKKLENTYKNINILQSNISHLPRNIVEFLVIVGLILYILTIETEEIKDILPITIAMIIGIQKIVPILQQLYLNISSIKYGIDSNYQLVKLFRKIPENNNKNQQNKIESRINRLFLDEVTFTYDNKVVISKLNFTAQRGDRIALIGKSGVGKSTLLDLIAGLNFPDTGSLSINNNIEINEENIEYYFSRISYVNQQPFILKDTILNNIVLFEKKIDLNKLQKIVYESGLEKILIENNLSLQDKIGDGCIQLSGGQRQRVALARGLFKEADIYIFDEITSGLDMLSEKELFNSIYQLKCDKILIIVSHNINNFYGCNKFYDVESGRFVESPNILL